MAQEDTNQSGNENGVVPIFLTAATCEIFECRPDKAEVTAESPFKWIGVQRALEDVAKRRVISDFQPHKEALERLAAEEFLLVYDAEWTFGQNFYLVLDSDHAQRLTNPVSSAADTAADGGNGERIKVKKRVFHLSKSEWQSLGSEVEIDSEKVVYNRPLLEIAFESKVRIFKRLRDLKDFTSKPVEFDNYINKEEYVVPTVSNIGVQAVQEITDSTVQAKWAPSKNATTQYVPHVPSAEEVDLHMQSESLVAAVRGAETKITRAIYENLLTEIDPLFDPDNQSPFTFGQEGKPQLKEYQSFLDLKRSRDKTVVGIRWHPRNKDIIAMTCISKLTIDDKIDLDFSGDTQVDHEIIVWDFNDPITPLCYLSAPADITAFRIHQDDGNVVVGGGEDGQLYVWDISDRFGANGSSVPAGDGAAAKSNDAKYRAVQNIHAGSKDALKIPGSDFLLRPKTDLVVPPGYASVVEGSHSSSVLDIEWVNSQLEPKLSASEFPSLHLSTVASISVDGVIHFWSVCRPADAPSDLVWRPYYTINLTSPDGSVDYACTRFFTGSQVLVGDNKPEDLILVAGCQDGEIVKVVSGAKKGKGQTIEMETFNYHVGVVMDIKASPFFSNYYASVSGAAVSIWKFGVSLPVVSFECVGSNYSTMEWSQTRPGVLFLSRIDGKLEIWDLLEKIHAPIAVQPMSSSALASSCLNFGQDLVAMGDDNGTLLVYKIPKRLSSAKKQEEANVLEILEREVSIVVHNGKNHVHLAIEEQQKTKPGANLGKPCTKRSRRN